MHPRPDTIAIPEWANGPGTPRMGSANGGWTAGLVAELMHDVPSVAVSLRVPPPLGRPLQVERIGDTIELRDGNVLVADAAPGGPTVSVPPIVRSISAATAHESSKGFPFRDRHPFPHCITCGTDRPDGAPSLRIHCGPVEGVRVADDTGELVPVFADSWTPTPDLADADVSDLASNAAVWSAVDCPSATPFADPHAERPSVLARITLRMLAPALIGEPHVLVAWRLGVEGRKQRSASVLLDDSGMVLGVAEALWIQVKAR